MGKLKTSLEYDLQLFNKEIDFVPLEEYKGAHVKILHECINEHQWLVEPNSILKGSGCPKCASNRKFTTEEYIQKLKEKGIKYLPIEPYITSLTSILHKCEKGHTWKVKPCHVLNHSGCNKCSYSTFDPNSPAILYYIKIGNYYKIGITKRSIRARFSKDPHLPITVIRFIWYSKGQYAKDMEQFLLSSNERITVTGYLKSGGNTELFAGPINWPES